MVNVQRTDEVVRDYTNASKVLIAIGLRILEEEEDDDEAEPGLRPSLN
jgi:hypothetical protein